MVTIQIHNHKSRVLGDLKIIHKLSNSTKIKAKNYFWSAAWRERKWDGYIRYVSQTNGYFSTGLLDQIIAVLNEWGTKFKIEDKRNLFKDKNKVDSLGDLKGRDYQLDALTAILNHKVSGIKFPRGILDEATNAGKSLIAGMVYASFSNKRRGLFLVNSKLLFTQALADLGALLPGEIGMVNSDKTIWKRINVCMVQTLSNRIKGNPYYKAELSKMDIVIVDEADELIGRKDCQHILEQCHNAPVRIALSGSPLCSKDKNKNQQVLAYFGPIIHKTTNKELVDKGVSTKPYIFIYPGNDHVKTKGNYKDEYEEGITRNKKRHKKIWSIINRYNKRNRGPFLILFKFHKHGELLLKNCPAHISKNLRIKLLHHKIKDEVKQKVLQDFRDYKVDVLLCSMIIRRAINLKNIVTLLNAAGGDSEANVLQIFGRLLRAHKKKKKAYMVDMYDEGAYLARHSKHRVLHYKKQGFGVKEVYKKYLKKQTTLPRMDY